MSYTDTYLSGPQAVIEGMLGTNKDAVAAFLGPRTLDGVAHACIRQATGAAALVIPPGATYTMEELMAYPETAQMAVGVFMADPDTVDGGDSAPGPEDTTDGGEADDPEPDPDP